MSERKQQEKKKTKTAGKNRHIRVLLFVASVFLTASAAACAKTDAEPTNVPTEAVTPEPTNAPTEAVTPKPAIVDVSEAEAGDTVLFGTYEQDNDQSNGAEAIEWIVLDKQDGKLLLLSKYALDCKSYNEEETEVTWETCTLREWLNGTFYDTAFSQAEQDCIATTQVKNEDNPIYKTEGGNDTEDKVFLLSIKEAIQYFNSDPGAWDFARCVKVTEYAKAQGAMVYNEEEFKVAGNSEYNGSGWWWLRSPGMNSGKAANIYLLGSVNREGLIVFDTVSVVRPAFWLSLEP